MQQSTEGIYCLTNHPTIRAIKLHVYLIYSKYFTINKQKITSHQILTSTKHTNGTSNRMNFYNDIPTNKM